MNDPPTPDTRSIDDPDARDLPPNVLLPDPDVFRLGQYKARLVVNVVGVVVLAIAAVLMPVEYRVVGYVCVGLVLVTTIYSAVQYFRSRRVVRQRGELPV